MNLDQMMPNADTFKTFNEQFMGSFVKIAELTTATQQKYAGQQMAAMQANVAAMAKMADAYSGEAKPADVYAAHVEVAKTLSEELMTVARESWETQSETSEKMAAIWSAPIAKARPAKAKA